jgi:hypothetical protein
MNMKSKKTLFPAKPGPWFIYQRDNILKKKASSGETWRTRSERVALCISATAKYQRGKKTPHDLDQRD